MFKIFVSYSTNDLPDVEILKSSLDGSGIDVFVAEHSVKPSAKLADEIAKAIKICDLFVLVWSNNAKNSEWVSQEIGMAHANNKKVLPLVMNEGMHLPGFVKDLKYINCFSEKKKALVEAKGLILEAFEMHKTMLKEAEGKRKQKNNEQLALLALGGLALWLFSK